MKLNELNYNQCSIIFNIHPEWMKDNHPEWVAYNHPEWMEYRYRWQIIVLILIPLVLFALLIMDIIKQG